MDGNCDNCGDCYVYEIDDTYEKVKMDIYSDVLESDEMDKKISEEMEMDKKISEEMNNLRELGKKLSEETEDANLCFIVSKIVEQKELISDLIGERLGLY